MSGTASEMKDCSLKADQDSQEHCAENKKGAANRGQIDEALEDIEHGLSSILLGDDSGDEEDFDLPTFDSKQCLFCTVNSTDLDSSLEHMLKRHGFSIPDVSHLIVDVEVFLEYLHLVIYGYYECLYCGSQRNGLEAAKQHMTGKGHCKIDILKEGSEFRDFYEVGNIYEGTDGGESVFPRITGSVDGFAKIDSALKLPSGKLLFHRSQTERRSRPSGSQSRGTLSLAKRSVAPDMLDPDTGFPINKITREGSLRKVIKQEAAWDKQLASLRAEDRRGLMHLPGWKQRALVMEAKKQVERARRDDDKMQLIIQLKANL